MLTALRLLFGFILVAMLSVTPWASLCCPLFGVPPDVFRHPWFIATMFDAYAGFLTFYVWVAWQQQAWSARAAWLVAILLLGNVAMAAYCLRQLCRAPAPPALAGVLTRRETGAGLLGPVLAGLGIAVVGLAWLSR